MAWGLSLPLLGKELAEQSSRPRTYILRTVFAVLFYGLTLWLYLRHAGEAWSRGDLNLLGSGAELFRGVVQLQFGTVYLFLPALMAGVVTSEKERDTLGLLLITRLSPGKIVLEKFLGRVVPMSLYLLMGLPLWGVAYSLGGITVAELLVVALYLTIAVLQVGSVGVLASVWCRTTAQALLAGYLGAFPSGLLVMTFADPLSDALRNLAPVDAWIAGAFWFVVLGALPALLCWMIAKSALWPRAFLKPNPWFLKLLGAVDAYFQRLNQNSLTRGIELIRDEERLPRERPLEWRETQKRSLGRLSYLIRLLIMIEVPLAFALIIPLGDYRGYNADSPWLNTVSVLVWWVAIFTILASSTGLITGERSRQSLDVLLSTPLSPRRIIHEKFAGVRRLTAVLLIPLGTIVATRLWWYSQFQTMDRFQPQLYWVTRAVGAFLVYPWVVGWVGFHAGLRFRSQVAALTACLGLIVGLALTPWLLMRLGLLTLEMNSPWVFLWMACFAPWLTPDAETETASVMLLLAHYVGLLCLMVWLRLRAPRDLVRLTGRTEHEYPAVLKPITYSPGLVTDAG